MTRYDEVLTMAQILDNLGFLTEGRLNKIALEVAIDPSAVDYWYMRFKLIWKYL